MKKTVILKFVQFQVLETDDAFLGIYGLDTEGQIWFCAGSATATWGQVNQTVEVESGDDD